MPLRSEPGACSQWCASSSCSKQQDAFCQAQKAASPKLPEIEELNVETRRVKPYGIRVCLYISADEQQPSRSNCLVAFAAVEQEPSCGADGCLVLRKRRGGVIAVLTLHDLKIEHIGKRMVRLIAVLPNGALATDDSVILAMDDDAKVEKFWGMLAPYRCGGSTPSKDGIYQPSRQDRQRIKDSTSGMTTSTGAATFHDASSTCFPSRRDQPRAPAQRQRVHRDIHGKKIQSSFEMTSHAFDEDCEGSFESRIGTIDGWGVPHISHVQWHTFKINVNEDRRAEWLEIPADSSHHSSAAESAAAANILPRIAKPSPTVLPIDDEEVWGPWCLTSIPEENEESSKST
jgi:hypothetical protein